MNKLIFLGLIPVLMLTVPTTTALPVLASGLSISDFAEYPEQVCVTYGDRPEMKDLCDWIDICDDSGKINTTSKFCTGEAVRGLPYPPGGCPEGFHSTEDDESGLCYTNVGGCEYEGMVMTESKTGNGDACLEYQIDCDINENHLLCNGEERSDGIKVCDKPDHPGYKFCNGDD